MKRQLINSIHINYSEIWVGLSNSFSMFNAFSFRLETLVIAIKFVASFIF